MVATTSDTASTATPVNGNQPTRSAATSCRSVTATKVVSIPPVSTPDATLDIVVSNRVTT